MTVHVRLFGVLRERVGTAGVDLPLDPPATAGAVVAAFRRHRPELAPLVDRCHLAVDLEVASPDTVVREGAELALLPPVAGGAGDAAVPAPAVLVGVRHDGLRVEEATAAVAAPGAGATVLFLGTVRDHSEVFEHVDLLRYEAYEEMAEAVMRTIAEEVTSRWPDVRGVALLHAVGDLPVGAPTIVVACSAPHRDDAYAASRHALEQVKARVPVWKREVSGERARWVGIEDGP